MLRPCRRHCWTRALARRIWPACATPTWAARSSTPAPWARPAGWHLLHIWPTCTAPRRPAYSTRPGHAPTTTASALCRWAGAQAAEPVFELRAFVSCTSQHDHCNAGSAASCIRHVQHTARSCCCQLTVCCSLPQAHQQHSPVHSGPLAAAVPGGRARRVLHQRRRLGARLRWPR